MKKIIISLAVVVIVAGAAWFALRPSSENSTDRFSDANEEQIKVLTTFFPLYDFTQEIGGEEVAADVLFLQTPEVSSFKPGDVQKINEADVLVMNGAGLEPILDELLAASDNQDIVIINTSEGVELMEFAEHEEDEHDEHDEDEHEEEEHAHDHSGEDPHIWLDPTKAIVQVKNIAEGLAEFDPANAELYQTRAEAYVKELEKLDQEFATQLANVSSRNFIAFHPAFNYLAVRYNLNQVAVIEESPGQEPSPKYLAEVIETIEDSNVKALFSEPQFSPRVLEAIANDTGLTVSELSPLETGDIETESYLSVMRQNLATLVASL